ncbi:hypothetical protein ACFEC5_002164, partial [Neisseria gonorrhoeae]
PKTQNFIIPSKTENQNQKPKIRHSRESGNPESLKLQITFEYCCCSKVRIPACAGMTAHKFPC